MFVVFCSIIFNMKGNLEELTKNSEKIEKPMRNAKGQLLPGVVLNPKGLQKGTKHFSTLIGEMIKRKITMKVDGKIVEMTIDEAMVQAMIRQVLKGSEKAFEALTNRHEGKPHQSIQMEVLEPPIPIMPLKKKP